jgi:hypothetical protein
MDAARRPGDGHAARAAAAHVAAHGRPPVPGAARPGDRQWHRRAHRRGTARSSWSTPRGLLCWIELAEDGKPAKLGWPPEGQADGALFRFEDWTTTDGYPWPRRVIQPEQEVVSTTTSLRVDAVLFASCSAARQVARQPA